MKKKELQKKEDGFFGKFGGMFVPPVLEDKLLILFNKFNELKDNPEFVNEYKALLKDYVGRPSPLYKAKRLSAELGSTVYFKREDLNHTGSHKINNTIGQILIAKYMSANEIIAETGAGQHGVATATVAALMGMKCKVFMGKTDIVRQQMNVKRMELLGAKVISVANGQGTLKEAVDAAFNYYVENPNSFYLLGSAVGPHPYPTIVRYFQSVISDEIKSQIIEKENKLPDAVIACIGGGSNAIGAFSNFLDNEVELLAAEAAGDGIETKRTAATLTLGENMIFQGSNSLCLADDKGNPIDSYSIAAGLDYPGIGPEHAYLKESGRVSYKPITDTEALSAYKSLSLLEGIIPAIESAHAVALAFKEFKNKDKLIVINLSGRGDKDVGRL